MNQTIRVISGRPKQYYTQEQYKQQKRLSNALYYTRRRNNEPLRKRTFESDDERREAARVRCREFQRAKRIKQLAQCKQAEEDEIK